MEYSFYSLSSLLSDLLLRIFGFFYIGFQCFISNIFAPQPPPPPSVEASESKKRIAIIGAGLTGVSSAAHCVGHGFDVQLFETRPKDKGLGGIWSRVNVTSSLQVHSIMFRFHPSVKFGTAYPTQQEVRQQIVDVWARYGLQDRTTFDTKVRCVKQSKDKRWVINDDEVRYGRFDGVIAAVGVSGDPKMPHLPGQEKFEGPVWHSSNLDGRDVKDKKILIVGGGASAIEALEFAVQSGAGAIDVLSRSDKWIIPRNVFIQSLLSFNVFGQETTASWIPEWLLRKFVYRDLQDIAPSGGLYTQTPMAHSDLFNQIRRGKARWLRGDIVSVAEDGIVFNHRSKHVPRGGPGHEILVPGDIMIMATGFKRPSLSFLPESVFEEPYGPPNWYLQVFPPEYTSLCATNSTYIDAIGTVGNIHIGIYTRLLLMFLVDPLTRPTEGRMKTWIDFTRFIKRLSPTKAFDFFTYAELLYWYIFVIVVNPFRWKWTLFILFGIGRTLPQSFVNQEESFRETLRNQQLQR